MILSIKTTTQLTLENVQQFYVRTPFVLYIIITQKPPLHPFIL